MRTAHAPFTQTPACASTEAASLLPSIIVQRSPRRVFRVCVPNCFTRLFSAEPPFRLPISAPFCRGWELKKCLERVGRVQFSGESTLGQAYEHMLAHMAPPPARTRHPPLPPSCWHHRAKSKQQQQRSKMLLTRSIPLRRSPPSPALPPPHLPFLPQNGTGYYWPKRIESFEARAIWRQEGFRAADGGNGALRGPGGLLRA